MDSKNFKIDEMKKFIFDNEFYKSIKPEIENVETKEEEEENNIDCNIFIPDRQDNLFWCIYICIYGMKEYKLIERGFTNIIMEEKLKIGNYFYENLKRMKNLNNLKITYGKIKEITSDYMTNKTTDIEMLYGISIYYKKRIILLNKNSYVNLEPEEYDSTIILIKKESMYGIHMNISINEVEENYLQLVSYDKPIKSISSFTVNELKILAKRFDLDINNSDKKTIYYNLSELLLK
tara:strand:+ start:9177 stop:9881 length:705 start_codon:yes stop_codon:yes gene_type:complete